MASTIGKAALLLTADSKGLDAGLAKAESRVKAASSNFAASFKGAFLGGFAFGFVNKALAALLQPVEQAVQKAVQRGLDKLAGFVTGVTKITEQQIKEAERQSAILDRKLTIQRTGKSQIDDLRIATLALGDASAGALAKFQKGLKGLDLEFQVKLVAQMAEQIKRFDAAKLAEENLGAVERFERAFREMAANPFLRGDVKAKAVGGLFADLADQAGFNRFFAQEGLLKGSRGAVTAAIEFKQGKPADNVKQVLDNLLSAEQEQIQHGRKIVETLEKILAERERGPKVGAF